MAQDDLAVFLAATTKQDFRVDWAQPDVKPAVKPKAPTKVKPEPVVAESVVAEPVIAEPVVAEPVIGPGV